MKKKIIAMVIMVAMMVSQLFVPAVFADRDDLAQVVKDLNGLSDTNKGLLLTDLWDYGIAHINDANIKASDILNDIKASLAQNAKDENGNTIEIIVEEKEPGDGKISEEAVLILINKMLTNEYRAIITDLYNDYKEVITKPIVKEVLGIPNATEGEVFVKLTKMSVPVLAKDGDVFVRNGDVSTGLSRKISTDLGLVELENLFQLVLEKMNEKIDLLAGKINEKVGFAGVTSTDVVNLLELYNLYEEDPTAPAVSSSNPANNATGVSTSTAFKVTYNKEIFSTDTFNTISLKAGSTIVDMTAAISGKVLTITPKSSLANSTTYTVNIPAGAVASEVMRPAAAAAFTFTTASSGSTPPSGGDTTPTTPTQPKEEDKGTGIVVETNKNNGEVVVKVVIGKAEEGKLVDKATEEGIKKIVSEAKQKNEEPTLVINAKTEDGSSTSANVEVPASLVLASAEAGVTKIEIATDVATFSVPTDAIELAADSVVKFNSKKLDGAELTEEMKKSVGDAPVFDLFITVNDKRVSNFKNKIRVSIPYELKEGEDPEKLTIFYINEEGKLENVIGKYNENTKSVEFDTIHFSLYTVKVNNITFSDVESKFWASKYIEVMASKGVIKGVGDGSKFAPNNNVTRAEFAAMIVREFKLFDESAPNNFKDVNEKDWFYPEVTAAAKIGLVQGRPGGLFAPNDFITREEMAKMLSNALTLLLGKDIPDDKAELLKSFKDNGQIADYARDAVAIGVKFNIFSGRPDGTFAPKDNANRAEASKLIYMLFYLE